MAAASPFGTDALIGQLGLQGIHLTVQTGHFGLRPHQLLFQPLVLLQGGREVLELLGGGNTQREDRKVTLRAPRSHHRQLVDLLLQRRALVLHCDALVLLLDLANTHQGQ